MPFYFGGLQVLRLIRHFIGQLQAPNTPPNGRDQWNQCFLPDSESAIARSMTLVMPLPFDHPFQATGNDSFVCCFISNDLMAHQFQWQYRQRLDGTQQSVMNVYWSVPSCGRSQYEAPLSQLKVADLGRDNLSLMAQVLSCYLPVSFYLALHRIRKIATDRFRPYGNHWSSFVTPSM